MSSAEYDLTNLTLLILLTVAVYVVIIIVFLYARRKFKGGIIGEVINLIITTIGLFLVADISLFLIPTTGFLKTYTIHVILKILAMLCLAVGGMKFFVK